MNDGPRILNTTLSKPLSKDPVEREFARKVMEIILQIPDRMEQPIIPTLYGTLPRMPYPKFRDDDPRKCRKTAGTYHMWLACHTVH